MCGADLGYLGLGGTESLFGGAGAESLFGGLGANVGDTLGGLNIPGWEATGGPMNPGGWSAGSLPGDLATMNTSMLGPGDAGANLWQIPSGAPADLFGGTGTEAGSLIGSSAPTGTTELGALTGGGPGTVASAAEGGLPGTGAASSGGIWNTITGAAARNPLQAAGLGLSAAGLGYNLWRGNRQTDEQRMANQQAQQFAQMSQSLAGQ